jgi:hypothetical protein
MTILAVFSKDLRKMTVFFFLAGLFLTGFLLEMGMLFPAGIQLISSATGALALLLFGGEKFES